ncbi:hypothetical protein CKO51_24315 [Rhodopirellula sp. SM50]|nr:hypothetical protein [Rhodopirellula sp. SM50]PAY16868.1 hypothetical protein CKO51_24315 [Rhodopirellula sp. SM50]
MTRKNIFVLGNDPFNDRYHLRPLSAEYGYNFHNLFWWNEVRVENRDVEETLTEARRRLNCFSDTIDGLLTFYDFPASLIAPILCEEFSLPAPSIEAVLKCEHKLWSRTLQREVAPEVVPAFAALQLDESPERAWRQLIDEGLKPPFWIKPVKGVLGQLAFKIDSAAALSDAMEQARMKIDYFSEPLAALMKQVQVEFPEPFGGKDSERLFIAENDIMVPQACTAEGYRFGGETEIHGIVDSVRFPNHTAFHRYQYPSKLPDDVQKRIIDASDKVIERIGFDGGAFNIEFFWDPDSDAVSLLEINPRISQSHSPQFQMIDGDANMKIIADLAVGRQPSLVRGSGQFTVAAKFMLRCFAEDAVVTRTPGDAEIEAVTRQFPGTKVRPAVHLGQRLSEQTHVDTYSWLIAEIFMGAKNEEALLNQFNQVVDLLDFRLQGAEIELADRHEVVLEY